MVYFSIGGKQSPPVSGQQLNPSSPMSVYSSPGQQPNSFGLSHVELIAAMFESDFVAAFLCSVKYAVNAAVIIAVIVQAINILYVFLIFLPRGCYSDISTESMYVRFTFSGLIDL